jgi:hypothetical protein
MLPARGPCYVAGMNELDTDLSRDLLQSLHILTREGKINQDSRRKLKQVEHLLRFLTPMLDEALAARGDVTVVDHGAGKSYLGFLLYDRVLKRREVGQVVGIEARADLVETGRALAQRAGFARMRFVHGRAAEATHHPDLPGPIDVVTALHACDTATDDAIRFGLSRGAPFIAVVPCCQAEVAAALRQGKQQALAQSVLPELWRHAHHTRELGSHATNVLRGLQLEASGYQVTVTELVGWEHAMKNELLVARKKGAPQPGARARLDALLATLGLESLAERFAPAAP